MSENRSEIARTRAGLSIAQAAKLFNVTVEDMREIEDPNTTLSDSLEPLSIIMLCVYYGVRSEWITGQVPRYDYASVDKIKGSESLTQNDRDVVAEFAASMQRHACRRRKPARVAVRVLREEGKQGRPAAGEASHRPQEGQEMTNKRRAGWLADKEDDPEFMKLCAREDFIEEFLTVVEDAMKRSNVTRAELARRMNCEKSNITQMFHRTRNLTAATMVDIAFHLDLRLSLVFEEWARGNDGKHDARERIAEIAKKKP